MASWRWASGGFPVGAVCHRLGEYGFALPVGGVPQGDSHDKRKLLTLLIKDPPIPYAEISAELGIAVGSIGLGSPEPSGLRASSRVHPEGVAVNGRQEKELHA